MSAPSTGLAALPQRARGFGKTWLAIARLGVESRLEAERMQLAPWTVVGLGVGIVAWFALPGVESWIAFAVLTLAIALGGFALGRGRAGRAVSIFALAAVIGVALIWVRVQWVASPRLDRPQIATFEATVEKVEVLRARSQVRLTLAPAIGALPPRVRVSIPEAKAPKGLAQGAVVRLRARLAPPPPMALPGTYNFARDAWFKRIGAVGKTLGEVAVVRAAHERGFAGARRRLREHIEARLPDLRVELRLPWSPATRTPSPPTTQRQCGEAD